MVGAGFGCNQMKKENVRCKIVDRGSVKYKNPRNKLRGLNGMDMCFRRAVILFLEFCL